MAHWRPRLLTCMTPCSRSRLRKSSFGILRGGILFRRYVDELAGGLVSGAVCLSD